MRTLWLALILSLWAVARPLAGEFEFVVIGDTRPGFESESFRPFESLIAKINQAKPALVVNLGDLIYGYGPASKMKQWDKYEAVVKRIQIPYYQLPGNHDTHSKEARRIYVRRFGKCYQSFDYGDCHFVLLDNTEAERWGYLGPAQLNWLREDLRATQARMTFVFLHFPVWEPERITPAYYRLWEQTLHPLFRESRVRAVFGGHYHTYGPTREFDGIHYYITGGGGAELRPDYRKSGGEHHFMRVRVSGDAFDVRVVTEHGELTDPEADVVGGLQFAARNVSRIGIRRQEQDLRSGLSFGVTVANPYPSALTGDASWVLDASAFSVEPPTIAVRVPPGATSNYNFTLKSLRNAATLPSLPRLQFSLVSGTARHRFHREVRFLQQLSSPNRKGAPGPNGLGSAWKGAPVIQLGDGIPSRAQLRSVHDADNLYLSLTIPNVDVDETKELGFSDEVQIGIARRLNDSDFSGDLLRLGLNADSFLVKDRSPGHKLGALIPRAMCVARSEKQRTTYEITIPRRHLAGVKGSRMILDLAFPMPEGATAMTGGEPYPNSFSSRVRYGSDSLVPVFFVELSLDGGR